MRFAQSTTVRLTNRIPTHTAMQLCVQSDKKGNTNISECVSESCLDTTVPISCQVGWNKKELTDSIAFVTSFSNNHETGKLEHIEQQINEI
eukprot:6065865-Amphidinium_carterae.1